MKVEPKTKIWLEFGGEKFLLPVNPEELEITKGTTSNQFMIMGVGQIDIPQLSNLQKIKFDCFFPGNTLDPYTNAEAQPPKYYIDILTNAMDEALVGKLTVKRPGKNNIKIRVTVKNFQTTDTGGDPLDMPYSLELLEYKKTKPEKVVIKKSDDNTKTASREVQRDVDNPVLRVGAKVIANGNYYYTSYGDEPHGTAKNLSIEVKRIVPGRAYPVLIGSNGWIKESNLQIKG